MIKDIWTTIFWEGGGGARYSDRKFDELYVNVHLK